MDRKIPPHRAVPIIHRGDIFWIAADGTKGSLPGSPHPHLVVQEDVFNPSRIGTVIVCALSSNLRKASEPGNVLLEPGEGSLERAKRRSLFANILRIQRATRCIHRSAFPGACRSGDCRIALHSRGFSSPQRIAWRIVSTLARGSIPRQGRGERATALSTEFCDARRHSKLSRNNRFSYKTKPPLPTATVAVPRVVKAVRELPLESQYAVDQLAPASRVS